ncbi:hypothetical protein PV326_012258, partial [Microctonus aethiopoides]
ENYQHASIGHGFQSQQLFGKLTEIFQKLAGNASRFASAASSHANVSFNNTVTRKAPKNNYFCKSESTDTRVRCVVCQKNFGFLYVEKILEELKINPGIYLKARNEAMTKKFQDRSIKSKTPEFKISRKKNIIAKNSKRKRKESKEEHTYKSNIMLMQCVYNIDIRENSIEITENAFLSESVSLNKSQFTESDVVFVYFDLETGGFPYNDDILQIAMKCGDSFYTSYVTPTKSIVHFVPIMLQYIYSVARRCTAPMPSPCYSISIASRLEMRAVDSQHFKMNKSLRKLTNMLINKYTMHK